MNKILWIALIVASLFCPGSTFANSLPGLPEHLASPFSGIKTHHAFSSANELGTFFEKAEYNLDQVRKSQLVPQFYVTNLPTDLNKQPVPQKTSLFVRLLLPSVVKVNSDILAVREKLNSLADKKGDLSAKEQQWLVAIAKDHQGSAEDIQDLLKRVDILPVGLIMAQAIDESGWGTSHFAIAGNALYGQHFSSKSKGTFLTTPGGHVRVATFDNLYHCTASYIHNLNTTKAYKQLRNDRAELRRQHGALSGHHLAGALIHYSERGQDYVDTLRWMIKHYKLDELNNVQLDKKSTATLIKFSR
ncbi:MAG: glucosaminidase domain-containing protein [Deltaproteobacteria bacterium]|nr:glucosaminidase domain-containing protein [Deltaproteobacteria bacterium]